MSRSANPTAVGGFVIGAVVLLVVAIVFFGSTKVFRDRVTYVAFFSGTVKGLAVGAPVEFRGVRVGEVTNVRVLYRPSDGTSAVATYLTVTKTRITLVGDGGGHPDPAKLVKQGLKATLEYKSLVTGQVAVTLDFLPDEPVQLLGLEDGFPELPTARSTIERVAVALEKLDLESLAEQAVTTLVALRKLVTDPKLQDTVTQVNTTFESVRKLVEAVESGTHPTINAATSTLKQVHQTMGAFEDSSLTTLVQARETLVTARQALGRLDDLITHVDRQVGPVSESTRRTMDQGVRTLKTVEGLLGEDSKTRYDLDETLKQLATAARSIRLLAEYLEQNPDALLKGRGN